MEYGAVMINLDDQQTEAVHTDSKRALVLAGAGSGKTRVLIERIAYLIEECKVSPFEVMVFTFTRKAAGEIRERLIERIGSKAYHVTMGTMHALALSMINRFGDVIGLKSESVTVYSQFEEDFLLKDVAQDMGILKGKTWKVPKKDIDAMFARYYQQGQTPFVEDPLRDLFLAFNSRCRENNSMTYGGLLIGVQDLIPTLAKYLHVRHVLVDEVQDLDALQWAIVNGICFSFGASLYVVGDIDQSIYSFRGAVPEYLVEHQSEFDIYRLEANYRSMPEIVTAANNLIEHNQDRITKTMTATREEICASRVIVQRDCDSAFIVDLMKIGDCVAAEGIGPVAVLAHTHSLLQKVDRLMTEAEIPHNYIGKTTALTNSEPFRRFHAFLKLIVNPYDNFSLLLIKEIIGITREEYSSIRVKAAEEGKSHFDVWVSLTYGSGRDLLGFFLRDPGFDLSNTVDDLNSIFPEISPESVAFIKAWTDGHNGSISDYLSWLSTYDVQDEIKEEKEGITLLTCHAAKGLEWPVVIVFGCNQGILPSKQAIANGEIEAERRLAYVAWTRAQNQLILAVRPEVTQKGDRVYESPVSKFIVESGL